MSFSFALGPNPWYRQKHPDSELVRQKKNNLNMPRSEILYITTPIPGYESTDTRTRTNSPPAANPSLDIVQELDIFTIEEELVLETISAEPEVDEKKKNLQSSMENMTPRKRKGLEEKPNIRIGRVCGRRRH